MRVAAGRRLALHLAAVWCAWRTAPVEPSAAWCGAPYPPFAYSLPWYEFPVGSAAVRVVGDISAERAKNLSPLLVLPPPGLGYEYLETLEALTISERRVAFATLAPASPDALAEQVGATLESLEAPRAHVLAHATAAPAALALAAARPRAVASLVLASPLLTADDAARAPLELSEFLGSSTSSARACVDAELNRLRSRGPRPSADAYVAASAAASLLDRVHAPVLVTRGGRAEEVCSEAAAARLAASLGGSLATFEGSGPLPHVDERARYAVAVLDFLDRVDGVATRRAVMQPGSMRPGGSVRD